MLSFSAVRVGLGKAGASCRGCGSAGKPGLAPAGEALFFASPKKSTQKKGDPMVWEFLWSEPQFAGPSARPAGAVQSTAAKWVSDPNNSNLRCSTKAGSRSNSPSAQTIASPDPLLPALLGPARRVEGTNTDEGRRGRALGVLSGNRSRIRFQSHPPSGCAEERRARRIRASDCLSAASSSLTPAGPSTAGLSCWGQTPISLRCIASDPQGEPKAWRIGALTPKTRRQRGRLFFGDFLLAKQKKVTCRRATPGQQANHTLPITLTTSLSRGYKC